MLELARPDDREAVNLLAKQVHAMHVAWRPDIYEMVDEMYPEVRFQDAMKQRQLYVAKLDGTVVGYVLLKMKNYEGPGHVTRKVMVVDEFCVHESCRGNGIGKRMMEETRALAKAFRCNNLKLSVYPQNDGAIRFYERNGFMIRSIDMQTTV